eukprot:gene5578-5549_t
MAMVACASASPSSDAAATRAKMTLEEKVTMLHGCRGGYVGNAACGAGIVNATSGLKIPPLNLNDGPQGFRGPGGSVSWPSGMTCGATFDRDLVGEWGRMMGGEFFEHGANVCAWAAPILPNASSVPHLPPLPCCPLVGHPVLGIRNDVVALIGKGQGLASCSPRYGSSPRARVVKGMQ